MSTVVIPPVTGPATPVPRFEPPRSTMARVGRHAGIYALGVILTRGISVLMLPVYTRYLSPADYGVLELISMTLNLISIIAGAKIAMGIFRYYHKAESDAERDAVVSTALIGLAVSYGLVGLAAAAAAVPLSQLVFGSSDLAPLIRIAAASLAFDSLTIVPLAYLRVRERPLLFLAASIGRLLIGLGMNMIFLVWLGMGVRGVLLSTLIANITVGGILAIYVIRHTGLGLSRAATRNLLRFGIPLVGTQLAAFVCMFGDRYFLQATVSTSAVGLYALAFNFGFLLAMIGYAPFEMVWEPMRFAVAKRPDRDQVYSRVFRYVAALMLSLAAAFALFATDVLRVMTGPAFHSAAALVPPILLIFILQAWTNLHDIGIQVRERTEYITLANWIAAGLALVGYAILVPRYAGFGAAFSTAIAFAVRFAIVYRISQRLLPIRYEWAPVVRLCVWAVVIVVTGLLLPVMPIAMSIAARLVLFTCYVAGALHLGILMPGERKFVLRAIASPRLAMQTLRA